MQVTTGKAKGRKLKAVPGDTTRPITDRVKQALFNILMDDVADTVWLDLFGGTGAVGIEALSRGARQVTFVDREKLAVSVIEDNLKTTGLQSSAKVIRQDAFAYLGGPPNARYDFIYVAPPQFQHLWSKALRKLDENTDWLNDGGEVIVQIDPSEYEALPLQHLQLNDERKYGKTVLLFYAKKIDSRLEFEMRNRYFQSLITLSPQSPSAPGQTSRSCVASMPPRTHRPDEPPPSRFTAFWICKSLALARYLARSVSVHCANWQMPNSTRPCLSIATKLRRLRAPLSLMPCTMLPLCTSMGEPCRAYVIFGSGR